MLGASSCGCRCHSCGRRAWPPPSRVSSCSHLQPSAQPTRCDRCLRKRAAELPPPSSLQARTSKFGRRFGPSPFPQPPPAGAAGAAGGWRGVVDHEEACDFSTGDVVDWRSCTHANASLREAEKPPARQGLARCNERLVRVTLNQPRCESGTSIGGGYHEPALLGMSDATAATWQRLAPIPAKLQRSPP